MKIELKRRQDKSGPETMGLTPANFNDGPSVYLSNIDGLDGLKSGDKVTFEGTVESVTETKRDGANGKNEDTSVEVRLLSMDRPGKDIGTKTAFKKTDIKADEDAIERNLKAAENNDRANPSGDK